MSKLFEMYGLTVQPGEYIFKEGDPADALYMVYRGKVQIDKQSGSNIETLDVIQESEFFGEMAVINSMPRSANALALEECQLIRMDKKSFEANIKDNHHFAVNVIRFLSDRLRTTDDVLSAMLQEKRENKFQMEMLKLGWQIGKKEKTGKWLLVDQKKLEKHLRVRFNWSLDHVYFIQNALVEKKVLAIKKDKSGATYITCALPRV